MPTPLLDRGKDMLYAATPQRNEDIQLHKFKRSYYNRLSTTTTRGGGEEVLYHQQQERYELI